MLPVSVFRDSDVACFCVPRFRCCPFLCSAFQVLSVSVFRGSGVSCFRVSRFKLRNLALLFLNASQKVFSVAMSRGPGFSQKCCERKGFPP